MSPIGYSTENTDHLQLIKFWPSCGPGKGVCGGAKIFGSALLQPSHSVCVSLNNFFTFKRCGQNSLFVREFTFPFVCGCHRPMFYIIASSIRRYAVILLGLIIIVIIMKKRSQRRKHCTLAVAMRSQKFSPRRRPPSRERRTAKI